MGIITHFADNNNANSFATMLRRRRFQFFCSLLKLVNRPFRILDVGGTELFWQQMEFADQEGVEIVILNHQPDELEDFESEGGGKTSFVKCVGDARRMPEFDENEFDVVFSNSVLEHVGSREDQQSMFDEVVRVGKRYFVQTPNYYFPIEPHFHVPGFQFFPVCLRRELLCRFNLGWTRKVPDKSSAEAVVRSVTLLKKHELQALCPTGHLYVERVWGLPKSFILYGGWEESR